MLGRKHRTSPPKPDPRTACRRAIETLESRQLLSGGHFAPAGGFAMYDRSTTDSDLHVSMHQEAGAGRTPGDRWGAEGGSIHSAGYDHGHDDGPRFDNDPDGRHLSDRDAFESDGRLAPAHVTPEIRFESYFGTDGATDWGTSVRVSTSTPSGGGNVVVVTAQLVPVKILIPSSGSTLGVVPPKGLPGDYAHDPSPVPHGPMVRQPAVQGGKAYAQQVPAGQRDQAPADNERAEQRQVRQPAVREARPASPNGPTDSQANRGNPAAPAAAAAAHTAGTVPAEAGRSGAVAAAVAAAAGHVVDVAPAARAAGAIASAAQGAVVAYADNATAGVWQGVVGRVEAAVAKVVDMVEDAASVDGAFDAVAVAADVSDVGSGLLYLPTGPTMFLGLAPMAAVSAQSSWWPSPQAWRVTEAVSLVIAVAGYGYCRADAERRRGLQPVAVRSATRHGIVSTRRPSEGL